MKQTPTLLILKTTLYAFIRTFPVLLAFEVVYKALCALFLRSLLSFVMQLLLDLGGSGLAFNERILSIFTNPSGLIAVLLALILGTLMIYFEFSVLILMVYHSLRKTPITLGTALKMSLTTFKSLKNPSAVLFTAYALGLLPLLHLGLTPSLISNTRIPNFITGELTKTFFGSALVYFVYAAIFVLFILLIFVLPVMVLSRLSFLKASGRSHKLLRSIGPKGLGVLGGYLLIWLLLFILPGPIPSYFPGISGSGPLTVFIGLFTRSIFGALMAFLFSGLLRIALMLLLLCWLTLQYDIYDGRTDIHEEALPFIEARLNKIKAKSQDIFKASCQTGQSLWIKLKAHPFVNKHRKPIILGASLLCIIALYGIFYNPPAAHAPIVIGHRGSSVGVENSLGAIQGAIDQGADYAEIDILLSKDNVPMVIHDSDLSRLSGENKNVWELTAAELGRLTLVQNDTEAHISTLEQVLKATKGKIKLLIELKTHGHETVDVAAATARVVADQNAIESCMFMSLDYSLVEQLKTLHPDYTVGYCVYGNLGNTDTRRLVNLNVDFLTVEENMVTTKLIKKCRKAWLPVYVWTVDDPDAMKKYLDMGVLGIITDHPDVGIEILNNTN